ncbi:MAG TPA: GNAT family N-acetyltransferase [Pyrinomonadaceae bacterium]|nr:GNAT family N-acetyltransferase [Pyrinomonadaceae bacterium]
MRYELRKAVPSDVAAIAELIAKSVKGLGSSDYSERQIEHSISSVFGVDMDLIEDGTYYVAESDAEIVGCGGWSRRKTLYGGSSYAESRDSEPLDPETDPAKIRAFFVHPDAARRGIGTAILSACEDEAAANGFRKAEMMSTLPGVKLYAVRGYAGSERIQIPVGEDVFIECVKMSKDLEG